MFDCKICKEKDARISDLKLQIGDLRSIALPKALKSEDDHQVESNAILNGQDDIIEVSESMAKELSEIESEAHRLLTGTYE